MPPGRPRLLRLFAVAVSTDDIVSIELAIREWGRDDTDVAKRLRRIDNRRMDYLRTLFNGVTSDRADLEARSLMAFSMFVGNHYIHAEHGNRTRVDVITLAVNRLVA